MKNVLFFLTLCVSVNAFSQADFERWVNADLLAVQAANSARMSARQIQDENEKVLRRLESLRPQRVVRGERGDRVNGISKAWAERLMSTIDRHPVVSQYQYQKYNNRGVEIGFCFGRATYTHLMLLRMGVNKDAIKKIWVVGPMTDGVNWQFHVATLVKGAEPNKWWVVDNYPGQVLDLRSWYNHMAQHSDDGKLQVFVSNPGKFSVSLGNYDRVQLGLDLPRHQDWYSHYFKDMLEWFSQGEGLLESLGLLDLRKLNRYRK